MKLARRSERTQPASRSTFEVMADSRLSDVAAGREVAGADAVKGRELAQDGQPSRIGRGLEEDDIGVGLALHVRHCIDKCRD